MGTITCNCSAIGALGKLLIEPTGTAPRTFTSSSKRLEYIYSTLGSKRALQYTNAITGSTSRLITGVRPKSYLVQGVIAVQPSPANLALLLPFILGGTAGAEGSGTGTDVDSDGNDRNYPLASVLPTFDALEYRENGIFQFTNLQVAQAILRGKTANGGEANEFMELLLVVVGEQEIITQDGDASPWPVSEPALPTTVPYLPYAFWETSFYMNDAAQDYEQITIIIDNQLSIKFYQSRYPTCIRSTGRIARIDVKMPFTCSGLEESLALNEAVGTAEFRMATPEGAVTFHTSIELPYARSTFETPVIKDKSDIPLEISIEGYSTAGNDELVVTNDHSSSP